jgi:hypothetical protein
MYLTGKPSGGYYLKYDNKEFPESIQTAVNTAWSKTSCFLSVNGDFNAMYNYLNKYLTKSSFTISQINQGALATENGCPSDSIEKFCVFDK